MSSLHFDEDVGWKILECNDGVIAKRRLIWVENYVHDFASSPICNVEIRFDVCCYPWLSSQQPIRQHRVSHCSFLTAVVHLCELTDSRPHIVLASVSWWPFIRSSAGQIKSCFFASQQCFRTAASFHCIRTACLGVTNDAVFHGSELKSEGDESGCDGFWESDKEDYLKYCEHHCFLCTIHDKA
jgi:hypothetical protein